MTHFNFWSKWPRPFFRPLDRVLELGYPVLWNVTITGLGATPVEPQVPAPEKAVEAVIELAKRVPPAAILWRYDPIFLSRTFDADHHVRAFGRLAAALAGRVDRVGTSFVEPYRRLRPHLAAYERETGDPLLELPMSGKLELVGRLRAISERAGIPFTLCCSPELREAAGCERSGCNSWAWAVRVHPELARHRPLRARPTRPDCGCSEEFDLGGYDTCTLGCVYSYGTCDAELARRRHAALAPGATCLVR